MSKICEFKNYDGNYVAVNPTYVSIVIKTSEYTRIHVNEGESLTVLEVLEPYSTVVEKLKSNS